MTGGAAEIQRGVRQVYKHTSGRVKIRYDIEAIAAGQQSGAARSRIEQVVAGATIKGVVATPVWIDKEPVIAVAAKEAIATTVRLKEVISRVTVQEIVAARRSIDLVVASQALDHDGAASPGDDVVAFCAVDEDDVDPIEVWTVTNSRGQRLCHDEFSAHGGNIAV